MDLEQHLPRSLRTAWPISSGLREGATEILEPCAKTACQTLILSNHLVDPIRGQLQRLGIDNHFAEVLAYASRATQFRDMTKGEKLQRFMKAECCQRSER